MLWTADIQIIPDGLLQTDAQGNFYWSGGQTWASGGAASFQTGRGIRKLSADGSALLYTSALSPLDFTFALAADGTVFVAGDTDTNIPVTAGAFETELPVKGPGSTFSGANATAFAGKLDLSSFSGGNFFVPMSYPSSPSLAWRLNEPLPAPLTLPVKYSGAYESLIISATTANAQGAFTPGPPPALTLNVNPSGITSAGSYQGSVTVVPPSNPAESLTIPVSITVLPLVSFDVSTNQIALQTALGQTGLPNATVAITPHFGTESTLRINVQSGADWLSPSYSGTSFNCPTTCQFQFNVIKALPPGTYATDLSLTIGGVQSFVQTIHVTYVVDPAAQLQVTPSSIALHVVANQPAPVATLQVTSSEPGVNFSALSYLPWAQLSETTSSTPGRIQISANPASAPVGIWNSTIQVTGALNQSINHYPDRRGCFVRPAARCYAFLHQLYLLAEWDRCL